MAALRKEYPETLPAYLEIIEKLLDEAQGPLWFRGARTSSRPLIPALYRHPTIKDIQQLLECEKQLVRRFQERSVPYGVRNSAYNPQNTWDWLFFMQHYGVPTRLLDWTENPLTALHFAVTSHTGGKQAAVWVLNVNEWNQKALEGRAVTGAPLSADSDHLKAYTVDTLDGSSRVAYPVALNGVHNSPRIVAQQGVFVLFGNDEASMQDLVKVGTFEPSTLTRITLSPKKVRKLKYSLVQHGVTESAVFPDLEGLGREMKRHFGFGE